MATVKCFVSDFEDLTAGQVKTFYEDHKAAIGEIQRLLSLPMARIIPSEFSPLREPLEPIRTFIDDAVDGLTRNFLVISFDFDRFRDGLLDSVTAFPNITEQAGALSVFLEFLKQDMRFFETPSFVTLLCEKLTEGSLKEVLRLIVGLCDKLEFLGANSSTLVSCLVHHRLKSSGVEVSIAELYDLFALIKRDAESSSEVGSGQGALVEILPKIKSSLPALARNFPPRYAKSARHLLEVAEASPIQYAEVAVALKALVLILEEADSRQVLVPDVVLNATAEQVDCLPVVLAPEVHDEEQLSNFKEQIGFKVAVRLAESAEKATDSLADKLSRVAGAKYAYVPIVAEFIRGRVKYLLNRLLAEELPTQAYCTDITRLVVGFWRFFGSRVLRDRIAASRVFRKLLGMLFEASAEEEGFRCLEDLRVRMFGKEGPASLIFESFSECLFFLFRLGDHLNAEVGQRSAEVVRIRTLLGYDYEFSLLTGCRKWQNGDLQTSSLLSGCASYFKVILVLPASVAQFIPLRIRKAAYSLYSEIKEQDNKLPAEDDVLLDVVSRATEFWVRYERRLYSTLVWIVQNGLRRHHLLSYPIADISRKSFDLEKYLSTRAIAEPAFPPKEIQRCEPPKDRAERAEEDLEIEPEFGGSIAEKSSESSKDYEEVAPCCSCCFVSES